MSFRPSGSLILLLVSAAVGAALYWTSTMQWHVRQFNDSVAGTPVVSRAEETATMVFAGDIMLSRSVGDLMAAKGDWLWPFREIASATAGADLAFANLETAVSLRGKEAGCGYCFHSDPRVMKGLQYAGFDVLSVANNHIWDYGPEAFADTLVNIASAGISPAGGGADLAGARTPVIRKVGGARVAILAYTNLLHAGACAGQAKAGANCFEEQRMKDDITAARSLADVVVVSVHAGDEYHPEPNAWQQRTYRAAVDAGADLVIGHHPHVIQPVEKYGSGWIAYSLGNFVFDQNWSAETMKGLVLSVTLKGDAIDEVRELPVAISRQYRPALVPVPDTR